MDPKKILGVDSNATDSEIQRAYRDKVKKHHPDMGGDAWAFQQVQEAYESLMNPVKNSTKPAKKRPQPANTHPTQQTRPAANTGPKSRPYRQTRKPANDKNNRASGRARMKNNSQSQNQRSFWHLFSGELPLQSETAWFILINCLDIFMTYRLLNSGAIESNPIADYFYKMWGFNGMIAFKLVIVAAVCVISQIVALKKINTAKFLLWFGTFLVGCVVVYSAWLWFTRFSGF